MPGRAGAAVATFQINEPWMGGMGGTNNSEDERKRKKEERRRKKRANTEPSHEMRVVDGDMDSVADLAASRDPSPRGQQTPPATSESSGLRDHDADQPSILDRQLSGQSASAASSSRHHIVQIAEGPDDAAGPAAAPGLELPEEGGSRPQSARSARERGEPTTPISPDNEEYKRRQLGSLSSQDSGVLKGSTAASSDSFRFMSDQRRMIRRVMSNPQFDAVIGIIILGNCFTIGLEQEFEIQGKDTSYFSLVETIYLLVYIVELLSRFCGYGFDCLLDNWVKFDTFLVIAGIITGWPVSLLIGELNELGPLMVLRTARLMRLARTVRLLIKFRELWMLVRGLLNSASTMLYTLLMLFIIIYIFSCMAVELITNHELARGENPDPDFQKVVNDNFGTLPLTMITLVQFASLDNMNLLYMPLIKKSWWLAGYFIGLILVVSIVLMNLITAVVVNSALEQAMSDKEAMKAQQNKQRKRLMKDLRRMFHSLDDDASGQVSLEEMMAMTEDDKTLLYNVLGVSDPSEVFKQLDVDGSGLLEIEEFCDGIWQVAISNAPIELKRIEKQVNNLKANILDSLSKQQGVQEMLDTILSTLNNQTRISAAQEVDEGDQPQKSKSSSSQGGVGLLEDINEEVQVRRPLPLQGVEKRLVESRALDQPPAWAGALTEVVRTEICRETKAMKASLGDTLEQVSKVFGAKEFPRKRIISLGEPAEMMNIPSWALDLKLELLEKAEALKEGVQDIFVNLNEELEASRAAAAEAAKEASELGELASKQQRSSWTMFGSLWSTGRGEKQAQAQASEETLAVRAPASQGVEEALSQTQQALSQTQEALSAHTAALSARKDEEEQVSKPPAWAETMMSELQRINSSLELQSRRMAMQPKKSPKSPEGSAKSSESGAAQPKAA